MLWNGKVVFERHYCFPSPSYHHSIPKMSDLSPFCEGCVVRL